MHSHGNSNGDLFPCPSYHPIDEPDEYFEYDRHQHQHRSFRYHWREEINDANDLILKPQITIAAIMNDTEVLHMLLPKRTESFFQYEAARILARHGCLTVLQWYCQEYGCWTALRWDGNNKRWQRYGQEYGKDLKQDLCECAALGGHRHILQWILQQDSRVGFETMKLCRCAASGGHLKLLQWLNEQGCEWDEETCIIAAKIGHLKMLQYAHENGCPWNKDTCSHAAKYGHLEILQYAHENGCPWDYTTYMEAANDDH